MNCEAIDAIISKFGTQAAMGEALGIDQSTISHWRRRGIIPARQQQKIMEVSDARGLGIAPGDFFPRRSEAA